MSSSLSYLPLKRSSAFVYSRCLFSLLLMFFQIICKKLVHMLHKLKFRFFSKLEKLDGIPFYVRIPVGMLLLVLGIIFFYIPFINGIIFMIVGARMLGKRFSNKIFAYISNMNRKSFASAREALLHTLKK